MTGYQIRIARELLGWSVEMLADRSDVDLVSLQLAEAAAWQELLDISQSVKLQQVLTKAGLAFKGSDIRLKGPEA